jgi:DNA-binding NarL/FixJ family response regulator
MANHIAKALIITRQEPLRESLRVLLASISKIGSVETASEVLPGLVEELDAPPALVLLALDSSYDVSETLHTLHQIKLHWPGAKTTVLVDNDSQYWTVQTAGADVILFEGIIAAQMLKRIDELLSRANPKED